MDNRAKMLRRLSAAQFAVWELHMYLNTHPNDKKALEMYKKHLEHFKELKSEFEECFGPITIRSGTGAEWLQDPWPWEVEGDDC